MKIIFMEIWKDIKGYKGLYQISNLGRVKSLSRKVRQRYGYRKIKESIMAASEKENGYLVVRLSNKGQHKMFYIHRLVGIYFVPNPHNKPDINHKKSNKKDNRWFRLEWATKSENLIHSFKSGTHKPMTGRISPAAKLTDRKVMNIKTRYAKGGVSMRKLADEYGVHHAIINGIIQGKRWPHIKLKKAA